MIWGFTAPEKPDVKLYNVWLMVYAIPFAALTTGPKNMFKIVLIPDFLSIITVEPRKTQLVNDVIGLIILSLGYRLNDKDEGNLLLQYMTYIMNEVSVTPKFKNDNNSNLSYDVFWIVIATMHFAITSNMLKYAMNPIFSYEKIREENGTLIIVTNDEAITVWYTQLHVSILSVGIDNFVLTNQRPIVSDRIITKTPKMTCKNSALENELLNPVNSCFPIAYERYRDVDNDKELFK